MLASRCVTLSFITCCLAAHETTTGECDASPGDESNLMQLRGHTGQMTVSETVPGWNAGPACTYDNTPTLQYCPDGVVCPSSGKCPDYISCDPHASNPSQYCQNGEQCSPSGFCGKHSALIQAPPESCCCWWWANDVAKDEQTCENCGNCVASTPQEYCHGGESGSTWCADGPITSPSPSPIPVTDSCCCWWWDNVEEADRTCQNCGNCVESTPESQCHGGESGSMWCPDGEEAGSDSTSSGEANGDQEPPQLLETTESCCCWWWANDVAKDEQTCENCGNCVASTPQEYCHGGESGSQWCADGPITPPSPSPSPVTDSCCCWWWDNVEKADRTCQNCGNCVESTPESQCHGGESGSMWCVDGEEAQ